ncbi:MAG: hypothetical protein ACOYMG_20715 [Candidatus Methylumidiphilus sp.]
MGGIYPADIQLCRFREIPSAQDVLYVIYKQNEVDFTWKVQTEDWASMVEALFLQSENYAYQTSDWIAKALSSLTNETDVLVTELMMAGGWSNEALWEAFLHFVQGFQSNDLMPENQENTFLVIYDPATLHAAFVNLAQEHGSLIGNEDESEIRESLSDIMKFVSETLLMGFNMVCIVTNPP